MIPNTNPDTTRRYQTLDEFWPYYVSQHTNPLNRKLHFWGTNNLLFWLALAVIRRDAKMLVFAVISSYAYAWIGHFFVEGNRPATLDYPVLSALGEVRMYLKILDGTMDDEIAKYAHQPELTVATFPTPEAAEQDALPEAETLSQMPV